MIWKRLAAVALVQDRWLRLSAEVEAAIGAGECSQALHVAAFYRGLAVAG